MDDVVLEDWWSRSGLDAPPGSRVQVTGSDPVLNVRLRPGEMAAAALGLVGAWSAYFGEQRGGAAQTVSVDVRAAAASLLGFAFQSAENLDLTRYQTPLTALYPTADDQWIHLHGGFAHLGAGLTALLDCEASAESVAAAVRQCDGNALEDAVANAGLCAALARTRQQWADHPQGLAIAGLDAVTITRIGDAPARVRSPGDRPLSGLRVADLTRVLAGPTCGRSLAAHGADVLRIGSAQLPSVEPFVIETGHGKRNAFVDLDDPAGPTRLLDLVATADVFAQSYRQGTLAERGFSPAALAKHNPGIVYVSINAYGAVGPWATRGGWEQLAQTTSGIAMTEMADGVPRLIPAAATDYTTGYLAAAGTLIALSRQMDEGGSWLVEASLCQTAKWLQSGGTVDGDGGAATGLDDAAARRITTDTAWGRVDHLPPVEVLERTPAYWQRPPSRLGTHGLAWAESAVP